MNRTKYEKIAIALIMAGLIIMPVDIRRTIFSFTGEAICRMCVPFLVALVLLMFIKAKFDGITKLDVVMVAIWVLCTCLMIASNVSNGSIAAWRTVLVFTNMILPTALILYRFDEENFETTLGILINIMDVFAIVLMVIAVIERLSGGIFLETATQVWGFSAYDFYYGLEMTETTTRFFSFWGHALTNAMLFSASFIITDVYYQSREKKYFKLPFFAVCLLGSALACSKTGITVLVVYMICSCVKNQKKILGAGALVAIIAYFLGIFDNIITRFTTGTLTTGRVSTLKKYFEADVSPFKFFTGYGVGHIWSDEMSAYKAGFEFPLLMEAQDFGILFSVLLLLGLYVYASYFILKNKSILCWVGFSLLFAEFNSYNGLSLFYIDNAMWLSVFTMVLVNCGVYRKRQLEVTNE